MFFLNGGRVSVVDPARGKDSDSQTGMIANPAEDDSRI